MEAGGGGIYLVSWGICRVDGDGERLMAGNPVVVVMTVIFTHY